MDAPDGITLAVGGTAVGAICTLIGTIIKARYSKTKIEPTPLPVELKSQFVPMPTFEAHCRDNFKDHENLFSRLRAVETNVGRLAGILETISEDLRDIKNLLMKHPLEVKDKEK